MKNKAVIIYGPPGGGKGTQAELLVRIYNFVNFDTGRFLERELFSEKNLKNPVLEKERENFRKGKLCSPPFVLKVTTQETKKLAATGADIVYSGSPRTLFEAFGDKNNKGLLEILIKLFGKNNVYIIFLDVPPNISLSRNANRKVCSVCGLQTLSGFKENRCSLCYGKLKKRVLDRPLIIQKRLKEYEERTFPIVEELKKRKFKNLYKIDGTPAPYLIHDKIAKIVGLK